MEIIEQIRQSFIQQFQDDDWHITDIYPSTDKQYIDNGRQFGAIGTYVVEMTAMRDVDGLNKHGAYNKAPKDTRILYTFWLLSNGKLHGVYMRVLSTTPVSETALRIDADRLAANGTGWYEITRGQD